MSDSYSTNEDTDPSDELGATEKDISESAQRGFLAAIFTADQIVGLAQRHRGIAKSGCQASGRKCPLSQLAHGEREPQTIGGSFLHHLDVIEGLDTAWTVFSQSKAS